MREDSQLPMPASDNRGFSAMFADDEGDARMPPVRTQASFSAMRADDDGHTVMPPVRQNGSFSGMLAAEDRLALIPWKRPSTEGTRHPMETDASAMKSEHFASSARSTPEQSGFVTRVSAAPGECLPQMACLFGF